MHVRAVSGTMQDTQMSVKTHQPPEKPAGLESSGCDLQEDQLRLLSFLNGFKRKYQVEINSHMKMGLLTLNLEMSLKPNKSKISGGGRGARERRRIRRKQKQDDEQEDSGNETNEEKSRDVNNKEEIETDSEERKAGEVPETKMDVGKVKTKDVLDKPRMFSKTDFDKLYSRLETVGLVNKTKTDDGKDKTKEVAKKGKANKHMLNDAISRNSILSS